MQKKKISKWKKKQNEKYIIKKTSKQKIILRVVMIFIFIGVIAVFGGKFLKRVKSEESETVSHNTEFEENYENIFPDARTKPVSPINFEELEKSE